jgi:hypothetical protein
MVLGNSLVNPVLIVGAVTGKGSEGIGKLVEKRPSPRAVVDLFPSHFDGDDFIAAGTMPMCSLRLDRRSDADAPTDESLP